jgi:hypothetical protein
MVSWESENQGSQTRIAKFEAWRRGLETSAVSSSLLAR